MNILVVEAYRLFILFLFRLHLVIGFLDFWHFRNATEMGALQMESSFFIPFRAFYSIIWHISASYNSFIWSVHHFLHHSHSSFVSNHFLLPFIYMQIVLILTKTQLIVVQPQRAQLFPHQANILSFSKRLDEPKKNNSHSTPTAAPTFIWAASFGVAKYTKQYYKRLTCEKCARLWNAIPVGDETQAKEMEMKQRVVVVVVIGQKPEKPVTYDYVWSERRREKNGCGESDNDWQTCPNLPDNSRTADVNVVINMDFSLHAVAREFAHNRLILHGLIGKAQDYTQLDWKTFKIKAVVMHIVRRTENRAVCSRRVRTVPFPRQIAACISSPYRIIQKIVGTTRVFSPTKPGTVTNRFVWHLSTRLDFCLYASLSLRPVTNFIKEFLLNCVFQT